MAEASIADGRTTHRTFGMVGAPDIIAGLLLVCEGGMPIYEYECEVCGARFEKLLFFSPHPVAVSCPECSNERVSKRLSLIASSLGSGADEAASSAACAADT